MSKADSLQKNDSTNSQTNIELSFVPTVSNSPMEQRAAHALETNSDSTSQTQENLNKENLSLSPGW